MQQMDREFAELDRSFERMNRMVSSATLCLRFMHAHVPPSSCSLGEHIAVRCAPLPQMDDQLRRSLEAARSVEQPPPGGQPNVVITRREARGGSSYS